MGTQRIQTYKLDKLLGSGAFGDIYTGHDVTTGTPVAVKLESVSAKYPQLYYEARIYHSMKGVEGIPNMLYIGREGDYNAMVLEMLGNDLEDIRHATPHGKMKLKDVIKIGHQILYVIEQFHNRGIVHRDIKPENLMTGRDGRGVYLIDFGLSKCIRKRNGEHIPPNHNKSLTGTPRYASVSNHMGREQGRRDDLEGLGFVLIYLLTGSLPWQNLDDNSRILEMKQDALRTGSLYRHIPRCFKQYFRYVSTLDFSDRPDYERLRTILKNYENH